MTDGAARPDPPERGRRQRTAPAAASDVAAPVAGTPAEAAHTTAEAPPVAVAAAAAAGRSKRRSGERAPRRRSSRARGADTAEPLWTVRPGWGLAANLTPPEMVTAYRLRRLRERLVLAACLVALFSAVGFSYGFWQDHRAHDDLLAAQSRGDALQHQMSEFSPVTGIQAGIVAVRASLATLLAGDVDAAALIERIEAARPDGVSIGAMTVTLDSAASGPSGGGAAPGTSLDLSGRDHIGTLQLDGAGGSLDDVPAFVDALAKIPGLVDVLPISNATQASGTKFTITVTLTDRLLTHRFDTAPASPPAGAPAQASK